MLQRLLAPVLLAALTAGVPAAAQDEPPLDTVMATVGETEITLGHMLVLRGTLPEQYNQIPPDVLFRGVLDQLVRQELLSQSHEGALSQVAQLRLDNEQRAITASEVIGEITGEAVTDEALQTAYDSEYTGAAEETEYRASHILVETEEEAQALVEEIAGGANFAALAQEHSTGPSGPSGGELGWFGAGVMVPEFSEAVTALDVGEVSDPVKTQFGWHVIKLNETRAKEKPALADVRDELADTLRRQALDAHVAQLEANSAVDRSGSDGMDPALINRFDLLEN
ncbi:peptidylprolyl isomerase [Roseovarius nitratireducens]|uniref:peptidylprolyl isomerase n=1 Tax=Roseovarius nitratireducens TaxID=2044597 RepID=UPI000CE1A2AF|nr:peptidylprolyl isomerase [Roseovarius nitratireducens]